jgi:LCP family protein required for cell wall assembly
VTQPPYDRDETFVMPGRRVSAHAPYPAAPPDYRGAPGQPPQGPGGPRPPGMPGRRRRSPWKIAGLVALVVVIVFTGAVGIWLYQLNGKLSKIHRIGGVFTSVQNRPAAGPGENYLIVGSDTRAGPTTGSESDGNTKTAGPARTDTIMVMHLSANHKKAWAISIPRDSWVPIPGHDRNKINAAFAFGGPALLVQTVEQFTGVHIDHFAEVDFSGFQGMTDAVGGVDIVNPRTFTDGRTHKTFPQGPLHLDGQNALDFVRARYGLPHGDFDRIQDQQIFLKALLGKMVSKGMMSDPTRWGSLLDAVTKTVSVDDGLSNGDIRGLLWSSRNLRAKNVQFMTAPVTGTGREGRQSVVFLDKTKGIALWDAVQKDQMENYGK